MAICFGRRKSGVCNGATHRCASCGSVRCDQIDADECPNQGFRLSTCIKCGKRRFLAAIELVALLEDAWIERPT